MSTTTLPVATAGTKEWLTSILQLRSDSAMPWQRGSGRRRREEAPVIITQSTRHITSVWPKPGPANDFTPPRGIKMLHTAPHASYEPAFSEELWLPDALERPVAVGN